MNGYFHIIKNHINYALLLDESVHLPNPCGILCKKHAVACWPECLILVTLVIYFEKVKLNQNHLQKMVSKPILLHWYVNQSFNLFIQTWKCRPKFKNILRTNPRLRESEELSFWILLHKFIAIICFSTDVRKFNIAYSVVHVQPCF